MRKKDKESKITYIFKGWQSIFDAEDWISIQMSLPFFQDTEASRCLLVCVLPITWWTFPNSLVFLRNPSTNDTHSLLGTRRHVNSSKWLIIHLKWLDSSPNVSLSPGLCSPHITLSTTSQSAHTSSERMPCWIALLRTLLWQHL